MKTVAALPAAARPYPQSRVNRNRDFVIFSHAAHHAGKIACVTCHGAVATMEPLKRHREVTMQACVDCHKQHNATLACNACHDLGQ